MEGCEEYVSQDGVTTVYTREGQIVAKRAKTSLFERWFNAVGTPHRDDDKPAVTIYKGEKLQYQQWLQNGSSHREKGPACITYDGNGTVVSRQWSKQGKPHREDGPAFVACDGNENPHREQWCIDGNLHREDGPADISYVDGKITVQKWYKDGKEIAAPVSVIEQQLAIIERALAAIHAELAKK